MSAMSALDIEFCELPPECEALRLKIRRFLEQSLQSLGATERARNWMRFDADFSKKLGAAGFIGMTWPKRYGGQERSALERYVVMEELLAAGAPVAAHWIAERQSALLLMRLSPEDHAPRLVPGIARGEAYFCIGMSEPDSGSDLASVRTRAVQVAGGWRINGRKVWTSNAHRCHWMIALVRTGDRGDSRHEGLSQFLIDMTSPGITVRPIINQIGEHDFNEVILDEVFVPDNHLIGAEGDGWNQVTAELAYERSGPERYLSSTQLLLEMMAVAQADHPQQAQTLGRMLARYATLRQMSLGVTGMLARGDNPALAAALVKDQGALIEQSMPEIAHELFAEQAQPTSTLALVQAYTAMAAPSFSLRGGTREILRGMIARGLGLR